MPKKLTMEAFIDRATKTHGNKYDYSKSNYNNTHEKIIIICKNHGEFKQQAKAHMRGQGCPKCTNLKKSQRNTLLFKDFCNKAYKKHSNYYKYIEEDYTRALDDVSIICPKHGKFKQKGNTHLRGAGCLKCSREKNYNVKRGNIKDFIDKANKKHNYKFDYSNFEYINVDSKSTIICPFHGSFQQTPYQHLFAKYACNKCAVEINANICRKLPKELARLKKNFSRRAKLFLRTNKSIRKRKEFTSVLGCEWGEFKSYLENNPYGYTIDCPDLDLDHITPISDATDEESFYNLSHYTNFQLLPREYNQYIKRAKIFDKQHFEKWLNKTKYSKC